MVGKGSQVAATQPVPRPAEKTQKRDRRRRIGKQFQPGHEVDDFRAIEEPRCADNLDRHVEGFECHRDRRDEAALAAQHGALRPRWAERHHVGGDDRGFLEVVGGQEAFDRRLGRAGAGRQLLGNRLADLALDPVGDRHDGRAGSPVFGQGQLPGRWEVPAKIQDVAEMGASKGIDRLHVVADGGDHRARLVDELEQCPLGVVGVLVLVENDEATLLGQDSGEFRSFPEQQHRQADLVVEVDEMTKTFLALVGGDDLAQFQPAFGGGAAAFQTGGRGHLASVGLDVGDVDQMVGAVRRQCQGVVDHSPRSEHALLVEAEVVEDAKEKLPGLGPVEQPGAGMKVELEQMLGDQACTEAVVRGDHDVGVAAEASIHPPLQLGGRLVGEGEAQDLVGGGLARGDQMSDSFDHHHGLARPGPGDDSQRPQWVADRSELLVGRDHGRPARPARPARSGRPARRGSRGIDRTRPQHRLHGQGASVAKGEQPLGSRT